MRAMPEALDRTLTSVGVMLLVSIIGLAVVALVYRMLTKDISEEEQDIGGTQKSETPTSEDDADTLR